MHRLSSVLIYIAIGAVAFFTTERPAHASGTSELNICTQKEIGVSSAMIAAEMTVFNITLQTARETADLIFEEAALSARSSIASAVNVSEMEAAQSAYYRIDRANLVITERVNAAIVISRASMDRRRDILNTCGPLLEAAATRNFEVQCPEFPEAADLSGLTAHVDSLSRSHNLFAEKSEQVCSQRIEAAVISQESVIDKIITPWFVITMLVGAFLIMFTALRMSKP